MVVTRSKSKAAKSEASKSETSKVFEKKPWTYWLSNAAVLDEAIKCFSNERFRRNDIQAKRSGYYYTYLRNKEWNSLSDSDKEYFINKALSKMTSDAMEFYYMLSRKTLIKYCIGKPKGMGKKRWTSKELDNAQMVFREELFETYISDPKIQDLAEIDDFDFFCFEYDKWMELTETEKDVYVLKTHKYGSDLLVAYDLIMASTGYSIEE